MSDATAGRGVRPFEHDVALTGRYLYTGGGTRVWRAARARTAGVLQVGRGTLASRVHTP